MTYRALLLLAAAPAVLPGVGMLAAPFSGAAAIMLGCQLALGRSHPWLPARWRARLAHSTLLPRMETKVQAFEQAWIPRGGRPIPRWLLGLSAAWSGFLLFLPLGLIPFSNTLPALAIAALGAAHEGPRAWMGWLGVGLSTSFTMVLGGLALSLLAWAS